MKLFLPGLWCMFFMSGFLYSEPATEPHAVVYYNGFENPSDSGSQKGSAASCQPVPIRSNIDASEAVEGKSSLLEEFRARKEGYYYPSFVLPQPVRLEDGPLYLSGYVKIMEQDPEANHYLGLVCTGQFPKKKDGWKGFEHLAANSVDLSNGWTYFHSNDLRREIGDMARKNGTPFEDACVSGICLRIWNMRPGEVLRYRVDDVRLTRFNPLPVPDAGTYRQALVLLKRMLDDRQNLAGLEESSCASLGTGLDEADQVVRNDNHEPDGIMTALLVGIVRRIEPIYWRLKLLQLAGE